MASNPITDWIREGLANERQKRDTLMYHHVAVQSILSARLVENRLLPSKQNGYVKEVYDLYEAHRAKGMYRDTDEPISFIGNTSQAGQTESFAKLAIMKREKYISEKKEEEKDK